MGRYANRFEAGGSVVVGATYGSAAGGSNTKFSVEANGQVLNRSDYPALSNYYLNQSSFTKISNIVEVPVTGAPISGVAYYPLAAEGVNVYRSNNNGLVAATGDGFTVFAQPVFQNRSGSVPSGYNVAIWRSTNAIDWSLVKIFESPNPTGGATGAFQDPGILSVNNNIFLCTPSGLYKSTDGIQYEVVYSDRVTSVASNGTNYILTTGGQSGLVTTDFVTYSSFAFSGTFTGTFAIFYSGNYYAFASGTTGVRFSADSGQTWTSPASGLVISGGASAAVMNDYLVVSTQTSGSGLVLYSLNPTGTSGTWTSSAAQWTASGAHSFITHYLYESGNYIFGVQQRSTGSTSAGSGTFAYVTTGLNVTGTRYSASLASFSGYSYSANSSSDGAVTFAIATGGTRLFQLGQFIEYRPTGTNWSGATTITTNSSGVSSNPFFGSLISLPGPTETSQGANVTNSGNRYTFKLVGGYSSKRLGVHVEQSGIFKRLVAGSGTNWAVSGSFNQKGLYHGLYVVENDGRYLLSFCATGFPTGIFYNRYLQSNLEAEVPTGYGYSFTGMSAISGNMGPVKNGVYFLRTSDTGVSGYLMKTNGESASFGFNSYTSQTGFSASVGSIQFSHITDTVLIGGKTGSGIFYCRIKNNEIDVAMPSVPVTNQTGGLVSGISYGVLQTSKGIYAMPTLTGSGTFVTGDIYKYNDGYFRFLANTSVSGEKTSVYIQTNTNSIMGAYLVDDSFGDPEITLLQKSGAGTTSSFMDSPPYFFYKDTNDNIKYTACFNNSPSSGTFINFITEVGTDEFVVPEITSTSTGQAVYIIAR